MTKKTEPGIFNPHIKDKPPQAAPPAKSDFRDDAPVKPRLDLDGDSYVIRFENRNDVKQISRELLELLYAVNKNNRAHLVQNGVWVSEPAAADKPNTMTLRHGDKIVSVYTEEPYEVEVFRRIGYALYTLRDKQVLQQHRIKLIKRG